MRTYVRMCASTLALAIMPNGHATDSAPEGCQLLPIDLSLLAPRFQSLLDGAPLLVVGYRPFRQLLDQARSRRAVDVCSGVEDFAPPLVEPDIELGI